MSPQAEAWPASLLRAQSWKWQAVLVLWSQRGGLALGTAPHYAFIALEEQPPTPSELSFWSILAEAHRQRCWKVHPIPHPLRSGSPALARPPEARLAARHERSFSRMAAFPAFQCVAVSLGQWPAGGGADEGFHRLVPPAVLALSLFLYGVRFFTAGLGAVWHPPCEEGTGRF